MDDDIKALLSTASLDLESHAFHQKLIAFCGKVSSRCGSTAQVAQMLLDAEGGDEQEALKTLKFVNRCFSEMLIYWYAAVRLEAIERSKGARP